MNKEGGGYRNALQVGIGPVSGKSVPGHRHVIQTFRHFQHLSLPFI